MTARTVVAYGLMVLFALAGVAYLAMGILMVIGEANWTRNKEHGRLMWVGVRAAEFRRERGRWPISGIELAPPACLPGPCGFDKEPTDSYGRPLVFEVHADSLTIRQVEKHDLFGETPAETFTPDWGLDAGQRPSRSDAGSP